MDSRSRLTASGAFCLEGFGGKSSTVGDIHEVPPALHSFCWKIKPKPLFFLREVVCFLGKAVHIGGFVASTNHLIYR